VVTDQLKPCSAFVSTSNTFVSQAGVISTTEQDGYLRNIDGFGSKIVQVAAQQFIGLRPAKGIQALIIGGTCFGAVCKKKEILGYPLPDVF